MKINYKRFLALLMALVMIMSLAACGTSKAPEEAEVEETATTAETAPAAKAETVVSEDDGLMAKKTEADTIYVGVYGYTQANCDPINSRNTAVISQVYDSPFYMDWSSGSMEIKPLLVDTYEYEEGEDGTWTLHLHLRDEAKFASGADITANDLFESSKAIIDSGNSTYVASVNWDASYVEGEKDVYYVLNNYDPIILQAMCHLFFGVVNQEWKASAAEEDWWDNIDASGPFTVEEMVNGSHARLKVRDDYWGWGVISDRPAYDYMVIKYYSEASTMVVDYENGDLDVCSGLQKNDVERIKTEGMEHSTLSLIDTGAVVSLILPEYVEELQDLNVRKAIASVVDVAGITTAVWGGLANPADGYISNMNSDYKVVFGVNEPDLEAAQEYMAQSAYPNGFSLNMVIKNVETDQNFATILQAELAEIGIELTLEEAEMSVAIGKFRAGETDLMMNQFSSMAYPSNIYNNRMSDTTLIPCLISDEGVQENLVTGRTTADFDTAYAAYEAVQNYQHDNVTEVPICEILSAVLARDYVNAENVKSYLLSGVYDFRFLDLVTE